MKANELMIGDWVEITEPAIKGYYQALEIKRNETLGVVIGRYYFMWGDYIKPIPLTAEILEKNGWRWNDTREGYVSDTFNLEWDIVSHVAWLHIGEGFIVFTYVHELQHALRLCGLNELADNFVVA